MSLIRGLLQIHVVLLVSLGGSIASTAAAGDEILCRSLWQPRAIQSDSILGSADQLLASGKVQEAAWAYERSGAHEKAVHLTKWIEERLAVAAELPFQPGTWQKLSDNLNLHETYRVDLRNGVSAAVKFLEPEKANLERFAFKAGQIMGVKIPVTVVATIDGRSATVQYFLSDLKTGWQLNRSKPDSMARFFDLLFLNIDRNPGNFLLSSLNSPLEKVYESHSGVLIDHEFLFARDPDRLVRTVFFRRQFLDEVKETVAELIKEFPDEARRIANPATEARILDLLNEETLPNQDKLANHVKRMFGYLRKHAQRLPR